MVLLSHDFLFLPCIIMGTHTPYSLKINELNQSSQAGVDFF